MNTGTLVSALLVYTGLVGGITVLSLVYVYGRAIILPLDCICGNLLKPP